MHQLSRWLQLRPMLVLPIVLVACTPSSTSTIRIDRRGEFRVLTPSRPTTLNPNLELDEVSYLVGRSIFSQLLSLNETGRLLPDLAERWTTSSDGLTYTFVLRSNVRWHDGAPLSSADVRWTFEQVTRDGVARDALASIRAIETPDAGTVVFRLKHPWAPFASDLAGVGLAILPRHVYGAADWRTHPANKRPIGTGPFKFAGWRANDALVLTANTDYFKSGPYVERVIFSPTAPTAVLNELLRGAADYTVTRPPNLELTSPATDTAVRVQQLPTSARYYCAINLRQRPFADVRVRRAIAAAIDRLDLVRHSLLGRGAPAVGWYTPDVEWAYNARVRVPDYDRDAARRLLDEAGLRANSSGERLRARMVVADVAPMRELADALRVQLAHVGIALVVERIPPAEWPKRVITARDFDLTLVSGAQGPDPDALRRRFAATEPDDYIGYRNPAFSAALDRGARAVDIADRAVAYHEAQAILAEDVPFVPLAETVKMVIYNRRVSGMPQLEARWLVGGFDFSLIKVGATATGAAR